MIFNGDFKNHKVITWLINERCNFRCEYCWEPHDIKPTQGIDIDSLSESLNIIKEDWIFNITGGGEPFLEKNIIEICKAITKKHYISVYTNLSTKNVFDFADMIDPKKCLNIFAAVHINERMKTDPNLSLFIEKVLYLQKKGFNVIAYYLAHPLLFNRMKSDMDFLKSKGIQKVRIKIFNGIFHGQFYPLSFTPEEKDFLKNFEADNPELEMLDKSNIFYGQLCRTGQKSLIMDRFGNLTRCHSSSKRHGNLFEKKINFDLDPKPCPKFICECAPEGLKYTLPQKGGWFSLRKENFTEHALILKNKGAKTWFKQYMGLKERDGVPMTAIKEIRKKQAY